ncbi:hypothetical protein DSL64_02740 [Dyadobacter luteus]|uniref:Glycosyl transferase family 1 domain-containing protein n=1 Tax=Dyadobacter luteus TaxID=2259619 RepID=A0A3D8YI20_9BACT|nr:glycosyltransferase family 4 protein [Dyadobacter luteus]REA64483.1 hypothetical protein DSL64_02740 [Dyadobacter luteus]
MSRKVLCIYGNSLYFGHERSNVQVFKTLKDLNFDLLILTNKFGIAPEAETIMENNCISTKKIPYPSWDDMRKPHTILKSIKYLYKVFIHNIHFTKELHRYKPDFIYIASDFMFFNLIPSFLFTNVKIVYRLGDAPVTGWLPFKIAWKKYISKKVYKFVCISKYIEKKLVEAGRELQSNNAVIYNYPPIRFNTKDTHVSYTKGDFVTFSYIGQINHGKGVHILIEAAIEACKIFDNVKFLIAGSLQYDKSYSDALIEKVKSADLSNRIVFLGTINNTDNFFSQTDVLITPSIKQEPLGNVLVEAKSFSTPSIIFASGGMPELVRHKVDGYICESNVEGLSSAIHFYLSYPEEIVRQSKNAKSSIFDLKIAFEDFESKWGNVFQ